MQFSRTQDVSFGPLHLSCVTRVERLVTRGSGIGVLLFSVRIPIRRSPSTTKLCR